MHSAFCPNVNLKLRTIEIRNKAEVHHIKDVLRLKPKDRIMVFNGEGETAECEILSLKATEILLNLINIQTTLKTTPYVILACAVPKRSKFEIIIEKATELGIDEILPIKTTRTEIKILSEHWEKKVKRYHSVAVNAAKQCKRSTIPKIHPVTKFPQALDYLVNKTQVLIPSLIKERQNLFKALQGLNNEQPISILIGPEGDFTEKEYIEAKAKGCIPVTLGDTILRVETAAIATMACIHLFYAKKINL